MFCNECGTQNPETNKFCKNCGRPLKKAQAAAPVAQPVPAAPAHPAQPSYYIPPAGTSPQQFMQQPVAVVQPTAAVPVKPKRNWIGVISCILGIASWMFYPYLAGIAAIALGVFSAYRMKNATGKIAFFSVAGIVIAAASILVDNFYFVLFPVDMTDTSFFEPDLLLRFF